MIKAVIGKKTINMASLTLLKASLNLFGSFCNFEYAGWLTEANHLGNVAYRAGQKLIWDAKAMKATNCPNADQFIHREYRSGWKLG